MASYTLQICICAFSLLSLQLNLLDHSSSIVIATKIQKMHDKDPNVYTFPDWGNPTGKDVSVFLQIFHIITYFTLYLCFWCLCIILFVHSTMPSSSSSLVLPVYPEEPSVFPTRSLPKLRVAVTSSIPRASCSVPHDHGWHSFVGS